MEPEVALLQLDYAEAGMAIVSCGVKLTSLKQAGDGIAALKRKVVKLVKSVTKTEKCFNQGHFVAYVGEHLGSQLGFSVERSE